MNNIVISRKLYQNLMLMFNEIKPSKNFIKSVDFNEKEYGGILPIGVGDKYKLYYEVNDEKKSFIISSVNSENEFIKSLLSKMKESGDFIDNPNKEQFLTKCKAIYQNNKELENKGLHRYAMVFFNVYDNNGKFYKRFEKEREALEGQKIFAYCSPDGVISVKSRVEPIGFEMLGSINRSDLTHIKEIREHNNRVRIDIQDYYDCLKGKRGYDEIINDRKSKPYYFSPRSKKIIQSPELDLEYNKEED